MFLCWCGCVFVVVFLCFCDCVFVMVWLCFCVFCDCFSVAVWSCFCGCVFTVVWLCFCGGAFVARRVAEESCRQVLEKSVGGECCRRVS